MAVKQIITLVLLAIFYIAYFTKVLIQKRQGIQTNQMGKGNKSKKTLRVERFLKASTILIVFVEVKSIDCNTGCLGQIGVYLGYLLILLGDGIFITAMATMKSSWRAGIPDEEQTKLITKGIYKISRNPAFLGFDLVYLGVMLAFTNVVLVIMTLLVMLALHLQILEEEKFLVHRFGQEYMEYKKKVGRYLIF